MSSSVSAVIPAAGSSRRMGFNKLLTPVAGITFLQITLQNLLKSEQIGEVVLVIAPETEASVKEIVAALKEKRPIKIVHGGIERQDSVLQGLLASEPAFEYSLIHDAARPYITPELVDAVYQEAVIHGAAVCGHPSIDTLKETDSHTLALSTPNRENFWAVQTPQIFRRTLIIEAYQKLIAAGNSVTDDTAAVSALGQPVKLVRYDGLNLKITRPSDWVIATHLLSSPSDDARMSAEIRKLLHDISNQITSVLGFAFLIDMDAPEGSALKDYVKSLNDSSQKCHEIITAMQKVTRELNLKKSEIEKSLQAVKASP